MATGSNKPTNVDIVGRALVGRRFTPEEAEELNKVIRQSTRPKPEQPLSLPEDDDKRREWPMADGLLDYFPNALAEVSRVSFKGSEKHNPGQAMHWARGKSSDHRNKILRHLVDAGKLDKDGIRHSANLAWRALANLQEELERDEGYPLSRGSKV